MIDDTELREIFKTSSEERLQALDAGLLQLEKNPDDRETIAALMREAHSLKGDGNMLGVTDLGKVAHQIESMLGAIERGGQALSANLFDRLAHGVAAMRQMVHEAVTGEPAQVKVFYVLADLMAAELPETSPAPPPGIEDILFAPLPKAPTAEVAPALDQHTVAAESPANDRQLADQPAAQPAQVSDRYMADAELRHIFKTASEERLQTFDAGLLHLEKQPTDAATLDALLRAAHSLPVPAALPAQDPAITLTQTPDYRIETIRVPTQSLDDLMTQSGELTVTKTRVAHRLAEIDAIANLWEEWNRDLSMHRFLFHEGQQGKPVLSQLENFHNRGEQHLEQLGALVKRLSSALHEDTTRLEMITDRLEEGIRTLRLMPLSTIFNLFPRLVRDLARQEGKQVELVIEGGDTPADKRILEEMKDPLLHMIYNAIDHGIESPTERQRQGKSPGATITLRGYQTASSIVIEVSDDGRGLDLESIKQAAIRRGLYGAEDLERLTPAQIQALILSPGFSSRTLVTEISGRGVGLDVLRTNVERLKGTIDVQSTPGQGCTLRIQLSKTLSTAHVLLVKTGGQTYALPVECVQTACLVQTSDIFTLEGHSAIVHGDGPVSVVWLADLLNLAKTGHEDKVREPRLPCIILQVGTERLGIVVDALIDEQNVVLKPQSQLLKRVRYISGATILATGNVCMVLNPQDLVAAVRHQGSSQTKPELGFTPIIETEKRPRRILLVEDSIATRTQEKRILESAGYEVVTAVDGLDGFNKLQAREFDAVISDVQMPNLDGLELTQRIRQHREYSDLPVVLVTTLASEADRRRGAEAGANAYITKGSFTQNVLFETLDRLI
ncbi:response regulator [Nodosilinea sp. E11]|uniref:hybrid sensor histidine kinase/response regulator n=1 Tax=Nodosilinea sp. E11 TaxID=3037479 RepID=UPI003977703B